MLIKEIVINASPLIVLFKSNQADLLPELFESILIPQAVFEEVSNGNDIASQQVSTVPWLTVVAVETISPEVASWDLGKGESAVLTLSSQMPDTIAVVDDRAARSCAKTLRCRCTITSTTWSSHRN